MKNLKTIKSKGMMKFASLNKFKKIKINQKLVIKRIQIIIIYFVLLYLIFILFHKNYKNFGKNNQASTNTM